jgi:hypothetical protein
VAFTWAHQTYPSLLFYLTMLRHYFRVVLVHTRQESANLLNACGYKSINKIARHFRETIPTDTPLVMLLTPFSL